MKSNVTPLRAQPSFRSPDLAEFVALRVDQYYRERVQNTWAGGHIMRGRIPATGDLQLSWVPLSVVLLAMRSHVATADEIVVMIAATIVTDIKFQDVYW